MIIEKLKAQIKSLEENVRNKLDLDWIVEF